MSDVLCFLFFGLSTLVALLNIYGAATATVRKRRGDGRGFSCVPLVSLAFAVAAWFAGPEPFGLWVFAPAALDPGTWTVPIAMLFAAKEARDEGAKSGD